MTALRFGGPSSFAEVTGGIVGCLGLYRFNFNKSKKQLIDDDGTVLIRHSCREYSLLM
jgi:hypothetical protein